MVKSFSIFFLTIFFSSLCLANDGAFRTAGNQLIPVQETDIAVAKEILTIKKISATHAAITVYYEFFNPKNDKELEVGFEAISPSGDVDWNPKNGQHPYISKFTVSLNGAPLPYKCAIVMDSLYYVDGRYRAKTVAQAVASMVDKDSPEFFYVYHFKAHFKKGINIIQHTYTVEMSSSVMEHYSVDYKLTPALRWANKQIDDFTLQLDFGPMRDLHIDQRFFSNQNEWQFTGRGKAVPAKNEYEANMKATEFFIQHGMIVFEKKNFKPKGELTIESRSAAYYNPHQDIFDSKKQGLPFSVEDHQWIGKPANELSKRILKNLAFARRGYIFKSPELQTWFEKQKWYLKDSTYQPNTDQLLPEEHAWLKQLN